MLDDVLTHGLLVLRYAYFLHQLSNHEYDDRYNSHLNQYNYIKENPYKTCDNSINYQYINPYITIEDIKEKYLPLGINHFRLSETISDKNDNLFIFLVNYFIKDEFKKDVYEFFIQT